MTEENCLFCPLKKSEIQELRFHAVLPKPSLANRFGLFLINIRRRKVIYFDDNGREPLSVALVKQMCGARLGLYPEFWFFRGAD